MWAAGFRSKLLSREEVYRLMFIANIDIFLIIGLKWTFGLIIGVSLLAD